MLCVEEILTNNDRIWIYKKKHEKGIAIKYENKSYTFRGFAKDNCIYDCELDDIKGTKMHGKMVNGLVFGSGSYRLTNGNLFKGIILENLTAVGEIIEGNIKTVGKWNITRSDNMFTWSTVSDHFKQYIDNRLDREGIIEGEAFTGTVYKPEGVIVTGSWINGIFQNVEIRKDERVTKLIRHSEISHSEISHDNSILVSNFTVVNGKKEGNGYFKTTEGEEIVRFKNDIVFWGNITTKSRNYEGFIEDNKYHGKGKLKTDLFIYTGEFAKGLFNGQGLLEIKREKSSHCGTFNNGRMTKGVVKIQSQTYDGSLNTSGLAEGYGILTTPEFKYVGNWRNDKFHGQGTLTYIKQGIQKIGIFEDGKLISGEMIQGPKKWKGSFNANGEVHGKGTFDCPEMSYDGYWKNDQFHGQGTLNKKTEKVVLSGRFENNKFVDGELRSGAISYRGPFINGKQNGYGTMETPDFSYTGYYSNGEMHGQGKKTMKDGTIAEGTFQNGALVYGMLKCTEFTYTGAFVNGNIDGSGTLIINGKVIQGNLLNRK